MKKILITGGSHSEVPLITALKNMGYYVISTGSNTNGFGHKLANKYIFGDFSDNQLVLNLAEKENVEGIISGCNDFSYISTAYACEKLNLPGHDSFEKAKLVHSKNQFMSACEKIGVVVPKTYEITTIDEGIQFANILKYPVILKPVDLTGGKGVVLCYNSEELKIAYENAIRISKKNTVIIEEYITGENHGASFLVRNNKVIFSFFDNEQYYLNKYLVSGACYPSNVSKNNKKFLIDEIEKFFRTYHLVDGLFHFQFIINPSGVPVIIDPCRRSPGDLYISLVQYSTNVDYPTEIVKYELGISTTKQYAIEENHIARECIMTDGLGTYQGFKIDNGIKDKVLHIYELSQKGDLIQDYLKFKAGIVFMKFKDSESMYECIRKFHELIVVEKE